ncbi:hypothetical protein [Rhodococcus opacus]|uniref:hypothetical protein n=1 Tax=Rhodococcus opacus TaxID=37919 RepID=UPI002472F938|nr:hypothetical protein [Rhodococcus opacus]MDH6291774.1 hypothetical protein [Rhodococcus opacus]
MARNTGARIAIGALAALSISLAATTAIVLADDDLRGIPLPGREQGTTVQVVPGSAPQTGRDIADARTQFPGNFPATVGPDGSATAGGAVGADPSGDGAANPGPAPVNPGTIVGPAPADPGSPPSPPVADPPVAEPPVVDSPVEEPPVADPPVEEPPVADPPVAEPPVADPPVAEPPVAEPPVIRDHRDEPVIRDHRDESTGPVVRDHRDEPVIRDHRN